MRRANRLDLTVALCFVLAAAGEAVVRQHEDPGLLVFDIVGALGLLSLAVRRHRPVLTLGVLSGLGVLGTVLTPVLWPGAADTGGVWILALMLASYSVGAHASGPAVGLGPALPLLVVLTADLGTRSGWDRVSGIVFVTVFVGGLPTGVGRLVRVRHRALTTVRRQRAEIEAAQRQRQESVVLAERVRTAERLQPTLVDGLRRLASRAESGVDPAGIEDAARSLLTRTREEIVGLTAPVAVAPPPGQDPPADRLPAVRLTAQRWVVLAAGAITVGLVLETSTALPMSAPSWVLGPTALAVGVPLALLWWRPVPAAVVAFAVTAAWARLVAPLDGSLSETGFAMWTTFAVGALTRGPASALGLSACLLGQLLGVGTDDRLGEGLVLLVAWVGGRAVNRVSLLLEETRANNETLRQQEGQAAERALVAERLRIARDIHDVVGHTLTVITLQAGAARRLTPTDPRRAREVVGTIAAVAHDGLATLTHGSASEELSDIVARVREAGLAVDAELADEALLGHGERLVALRIVQEALTNVIRHAPGSRATVWVGRVGNCVEVRVANTPGTGAPSGRGNGRGLLGIRERVDASCGSVVWGPRAGGGFELRASLPMSAPLGVPS
ncbi:MAG TPA: histidine kinase [Pedococcus sp.]|nr:histidine kinase [Pedococcus sp.]